MTSLLAGLYTMAIAAFLVASMYLTGVLTAGDITGLVGVS